MKWFKIILTTSTTLLLATYCFAQQQLPAEKMFDGSIRITDPLLRVKQWTSGKLFLSVTDFKDSTDRTVVVDLKKGKIVEDKTGSLSQPALSIPKDKDIRKSLGEAVNITYSPDSNYVAYTRDNDLYTFHLLNKKETRLTFDGNKTLLNGYASWIYMEEILGRPSQYRAFWWSPDSRRIAFFQTDDSRLPLYTVTDSPGQNGYVETLRYPKPGNNLPIVKTGIVSADGGEIVWAQIDENEEFYFGLPYWRPDSKALWLQWLDRKQQNYRLLETDIQNGTTTLLHSEQQNTWINLDDEPRILFLPSGKGFIFQSDESGWNHLYLHDMTGRRLQAITSGAYTVLKVLKVDEPAKTVYFTCYKDNIACEDFYRVSLDGKNLQRLSFGNYHHQISLSDDGQYFVTTYSNTSTPHKVALYTTKGKLVTELQDSKNANFDLYEHPVTEIVTITTTDGKYNLPMRITLPLQMEKGRVYPVKLNIYGGPGRASVRNNWINNFGGDNHQYAADGLIQAVIDHRGGLHNGKLGQNEMYRNLGYWEIQDYSQCVRWLIAQRQVDSAKIMITGFSYGGYLTAYALTYGAEVFTHGIAGGSVTDWHLYDAIYTERFMDTPTNNPDGYKNSSVVNHADRLEGKLLLTHGLRDENVHAQNTFQLASALQELGKNFELMIYPESRHGYRGHKSKHSRISDINFIYKYLLEKPVPTDMIK
ncbi:MAG: S9 family peptidase [Bacteroidales bacterium]|nr:S9 family peptidase [Bacteroidales bacterium]